jgi:hypothetical protein
VTVKELMDALKKLPEHAHVIAYEGESVGISIYWENDGYEFLETPELKGPVPTAQGNGSAQ